MKVTHVTTHVLQTPADSPLAPDAPNDNSNRQFVTLELGTDAGIEGIGITGFGGPLTHGLWSAVDTLARLLIGEDPLRIEAIVQRLRQAASSSGPDGIFTLAMAAIDIALWDIKGKFSNQPLWVLIGGFRDRVPTYASGALMRSFPLEYLAKVAPKLLEKSFRQMKMQLGAEPTARQEIERVRIVRESIGEDIDLMVDVNQLWNVKQAVELGRRLEPYGVYWLEDPVHHEDYGGLARIAAVLPIRIAAGEYVYGLGPFRHMLERGAIDVVMIDLWRVGGISQWLKVAAIAEAHHLPVVSHVIPEIQVHLIAGIRNGLTVEYMPWTERFFEETPQVDGGQLIAPRKPGLGLTFDRAAIQHYQVG